MNSAKKRYKAKITRKYVEFYPTETDLVTFIEKQQSRGISFASIVKGFIRYYLYLSKLNEGEKNDGDK